MLFKEGQEKKYMSKKAGAVSAETKENIIQAAKDEFAEHGFQGTSLRKISARAGVTTGAIYFFFEGKDDLFETIISSVTKPFMEYMKAHYDAEHNNVKRDEDADLQISVQLIDFYFQSQQTWNILLQHMNHPAVSTFLDDFIDYSTDHYMYFITEAEKASPKTNPVDRFAVHQFVHMQVDTMLTLISHNFKKEEMLFHSKTVTKMLHAAFTSLLTK